MVSQLSATFSDANIPHA